MTEDRESRTESRTAPAPKLETAPALQIKKIETTLKQYIGLTQKVCLYIPSKDRDGVRLTEREKKRALDVVKNCFSSWFGGYTLGHHIGGWWSIDKNREIEENIIIIYSNTKEKTLNENINKLISLSNSLCKYLKQSIISLEINNTLFFIDDSETENADNTENDEFINLNDLIKDDTETEEETDDETEDEDEERHPIIDNDIYENHAEYTEHKKIISNEKKIFDLSSIYNYSELKEAEIGDIFEEWNGYNRQFYKVISFTNYYFRYKELHSNNIICRYEPNEEGQNRYEILNTKSILYHTKNTNITQYRRKKGIIRAVKKQYINNDKFICDTYYNN